MIFVFQFATIVLVKMFFEIRSTCSVDLQFPFMFRVRVTLTSTNASHSIGALHIVAPTPWCCQIPSFLSHGDLVVKWQVIQQNLHQYHQYIHQYLQMFTILRHRSTTGNRSLVGNVLFFLLESAVVEPKVFSLPWPFYEWSILKGLSWQGLVTLSRTTSSGFGSSQVAIVRLVWK